MVKTPIFSESSHVENDISEVMVRGPDGIAISLTPEAAVETGLRLIDNAADAKGKQMIFDDDAKQRPGHDTA